MYLVYSLKIFVNIRWIAQGFTHDDAGQPLPAASSSRLEMLTDLYGKHLPD